MNMLSRKNTNSLREATAYAFLAAALYALNMPFSRLLLGSVDPLYMAAFLYLGAGLGMLGMWVLRTKPKARVFAPIEKDEKPYILGMVLLDILAPALLMFGLRSTLAANASLLNNFEIVATSLIALILFKEAISRRLWIGIVLVTLASVLLSMESLSVFRFSSGSLLILAASTTWGLENNFTRKLSNRASSDIVIIKGIGSGLGSLILALLTREAFPQVGFIFLTMLLGFVAYGLSINYYVKAQMQLGAAKTSAYYAVAPFLGVIFSFLIFRALPLPTFWVGLILMAAATWFLITDTISIQHTHPHKHTKLEVKSVGDDLLPEMVEYTHTHFHAHQKENEEDHDHSHPSDAGNDPAGS
jgi:drug/metabolite transporter (DMT)-like permease